MKKQKSGIKCEIVHLLCTRLPTKRNVVILNCIISIHMRHGGSMHASARINYFVFCFSAFEHARFSLSSFLFVCTLSDENFHFVNDFRAVACRMRVCVLRSILTSSQLITIHLSIEFLLSLASTWLTPVLHFATDETNTRAFTCRLNASIAAAHWFNWMKRLFLPLDSRLSLLAKYHEIWHLLSQTVLAFIIFFYFFS